MFSPASQTGFGGGILLAVSVFLGLPLEVSAAAPPAQHPSLQVRKLFQKYCFQCHGDQAKPKGGLGHITDLDRMVSIGQITPGDPKGSPLFDRIVLGDMPPPSTKVQVDQVSRELLKKWILDGANLPVLHQKSPTYLEQLTAVAKDLQQHQPHDRTFLRYLVADHLVKQSKSSHQLIQMALGKLLNSLSWHARITPPRLLPGGVVYAIDLRHYRWSARQWDRLAANDPYQRASSGDVHQSIQEMTKSARPILRADWFVATASRTPHYHDLLALPTTDRALERILQVDVGTNYTERTVIRAGFNGSGVARANRILERHDSTFGAYWRSFDFNDNTDRQNIFDFPLGPNPGPAGFRHVGGEIIFHLPNGLQAYFVVDADGKRIDKAPGEVVTDPNRPDRLVENGISCMGCHAQGILPKEDQIRAQVLKNPKLFSKAIREDILGLYLPTRLMKSMIKEDNHRFHSALKKLNIVPTDADPILTVVRQYEDTLDVRRAASEIQLPPDALRQLLQQHPDLGRTLAPLSAGRQIQRQVFEEQFPRLIALLPVDRETKPSTQLANRFTRHQASVVAIACSGDGQLVASADRNGVLFLWNTHTNTSRELLRTPNEITTLQFTPDKKCLLVGGVDRILQLLDVKSGKLIRNYVGHTASVTIARVAPGGQWFVSGGEDRSVRIWNVQTGKELHALSGHRGTISFLCLSNDGKFLLSGDTHRQVFLWDFPSGRKIAHLPFLYNLTALSFSPDGKQFFVATKQPSLILFERSTQKVIQQTGAIPGTLIWIQSASNSKSLLAAIVGSESEQLSIQKLNRHSLRSGVVALQLQQKPDSIIILPSGQVVWVNDRLIRIKTLSPDSTLLSK